MGRFQAYRIAIAARGEFALHRTQQIVNLFLLDEQVAVAGDTELIAAAHTHAVEQSRDECFNDRAQEHELTASQFVRNPDEPRQRTRGLNDGEAAVAPKPVLPLDDDREIQALVEYLGKRSRRIERERTQHRFHLAREVSGDPCTLRLRPGFRVKEDHAMFGEFRHEAVVQQGVLLADQSGGAGADGLQLLRGRHPVGRGLGRAGFDEFLETGDPDFEEFVQVRARDAQELDALQHGQPGIPGLFQHALIELEKRQLAIDIKLCG